MRKNLISLINKNGEIVGIASNIFSTTGENIGLGFAIPINKAINIAERIINFGYIQKGYIGLSAVDLSKNDLKILNINNSSCIIVTNVVKNGPAYKSGIMVSDVIILFNEKKIDNLYSFNKAIENTDINSTVSVIILRKGEYLKKYITIKEDKTDIEEENNKKSISDN